MDVKISINAYGLNLEKQNQILHDMLATAKSMKVCDSNKLYQFQKGLIISSQSLMKLYDMVRVNHNISYIMTYRLNQDALEHFFASVRQMGATYEHPSPFSFKYRIRSHIVHKESALVGNRYR